MAVTKKIDNPARIYLMYVLTPPAVALASVLLLGRSLGDTNSVLSVFFTVFIFTAIATLATSLIPVIKIAIQRSREKEAALETEIVDAY